MKINRLLSFYICIQFFYTCSNDTIRSSYRDFENGWELNDTVFFKFNSFPDKKYDIQFYIRNDNNYEYSNLFMIASLNEDNILITKDTLEYLMADKEGNFLGSGYGNIRESFLIWIDEYDFKKGSDYLITLNHAMRKNREEKGLEILSGVVSLGIKFSEKKSDNE
tara:strand:- start:3391 stop:3885 length:495 start_codon:yes stop_codon:yes gene_type:complete